MQSRRFGRIGREVSEIGFGAWQVGADWGEVDEDTAMATLHAAADAGVTFFDTADVYGDGRSERLVGRLMKGAARAALRDQDGPPEDQTVPTTRRSTSAPGTTARARTSGSTRWSSSSCTARRPTSTTTRRSSRTSTRWSPRAGSPRYGVSVERVEEALKAIEYPDVATVQIIFNAFRQRPAGVFFEQAAKRGVGVIVRVPLASGLLSGKYTRETTFGADDHRNYNRAGAAFDVGETFAGVPFDVGLDAVEALRPLVGGDATMAQFALRWILMSDAVTTVIPGARSPEQARANAAAAALPALDASTMDAVRSVYEERIAPYVHQRW